MLFIIWYLALGLLLIYGAAFVHLLRAEIKGYDACRWWDENNPIDLMNHDDLILTFVMGMVVWPVRLIQFVTTIPEYYKKYPFKGES